MADDHRELLQRYVDSAFKDRHRLSRMEAVILAETYDLPDELRGIVDLLPPGTYARQSFCDQINSAITGHAWEGVYGTVE